MVDQNPRLEENELEEDLAPAPPKVQRLNSDASVLNALYWERERYGNEGHDGFDYQYF